MIGAGGEAAGQLPLGQKNKKNHQADEACKSQEAAADKGAEDGSEGGKGGLEGFLSAGSLNLLLFQDDCGRRTGRRRYSRSEEDSLARMKRQLAEPGEIFAQE